MECLHRAGRFLSGKSTGAYNLEDLSGRPAESGGDGPGVPEIPPDHHEGSDHAAQLHQRYGRGGLRRGGCRHGGGGDGIFAGNAVPFRDAFNRSAGQRVFPAPTAAGFFLSHRHERHGGQRQNFQHPGPAGAGGRRENPSGGAAGCCVAGCSLLL